MSTTPNESGISQSGGAGFHLLGKGSNKKWHIKMLVSFGATFICLLLITAAIELHLSQKDHFGWLNCDYNRKGPSTEPGEIVEPAEVVTQPPAVGYESCVSSDECGKALVHGYIKLHARDCNQDGVISCRDHIILHQVGPTECQTRRLQSEVKERINRCLRLKELE